MGGLPNLILSSFRRLSLVGGERGWSLDSQGEVLRMRLGSPPRVDYLQEGDKQCTWDGWFA